MAVKFKENAKKVLGKDVHFNCLRHSGITHYIVAKKWSTLEVQRLARHSKVATTQIYTHIRSEEAHLSHPNQRPTSKY